MDSRQSGSSSFELLDERIRRWVWEQKWETLRDAQEAAIPEILQGTHDLIITAPTSAGKTEAAFLPVLSRVLEEDLPSIRALYIGPLKALINDQFERLELLCEHLHVDVHRWHGDVSQSKKSKVTKQPSGVLLITPESLEALFMRQGPRVATMFKHLSYVIVDEVHSFISSERGAQLRSLMHRLEAAIDRRVPRIGLSATLSDPSLAAEFLRRGSGKEAVIIATSGGGGEIKAQIRGFVTRTAKASDQDGELSAEAAIVRHILDVTRGTHNLVFCNRKDHVELYADALSQECHRQVWPDEYCAHHGNLSKEIRESAEVRLKSRERPASCVCTSTLEMGIDIGPMKSVVQIGPPPSVASLRQRVGRSGRRGEPAILRMVAVEDRLESNSSLADSLRLELVQCIAVLQLMAEGWCEPPIDNALHLSTLIQQVLSVIVQRGGASISYLRDLLVNQGPFRSVGQYRFVALLRAMKARELVEQMEDGTLLVGRVGERLTEHYSFYAAFATPEEYRLIANSKCIGTMPLTVPLKSGDPLLFAGRRWQVFSVDEEHSTIYLQPGHGKRPPRFLGDGAWLDRRVRETMRKVFVESTAPAFLDETARGLLAEGRHTFNEIGLNESSILEQGLETLVFHWSGDREAGTLRLLMEHCGLSVDPGLSYLTAESRADEVLATLREVAGNPLFDPVVLARDVQNKGSQKYDWVLSDDLAADEFASEVLDVPGAVAVAQQLLDKHRDSL